MQLVPLAIFPLLRDQPGFATRAAFKLQLLEGSVILAIPEHASEISNFLSFHHSLKGSYSIRLGITFLGAEKRR